MPSLMFCLLPAGVQKACCCGNPGRDAHSMGYHQYPGLFRLLHIELPPGGALNLAGICQPGLFELQAAPLGDGFVMPGFTRALGVRCSYCHVGEEGESLSTYDFASDD